MLVRCHIASGWGADRTFSDRDSAGGVEMWLRIGNISSHCIHCRRKSDPNRPQYRCVLTREVRGGGNPQNGNKTIRGPNQ